MDEITSQIGRVQGLANQLVLVVGRAGSGKTKALREVSERAGFPYISVGVALGARLLEVSPLDRPRRVSPTLSDLLRNQGSVVLLDNLEILFEPSLQVDPLTLLDTLSRSQTVVATWNGALAGSMLTYAETGHPEFRSYPLGQRVVIPAGIGVGIESVR